MTAPADQQSRRVYHVLFMNILGVDMSLQASRSAQTCSPVVDIMQRIQVIKLIVASRKASHTGGYGEMHEKPCI